MITFIKKIIPEDFFIRIWWHRLVGFVAALYYGFPAKKLKVIGITGTDGKSSTVEFLASILEESGLKIGVASTIRFQIGDRKWKNKTHKTTMGRFRLQKLLSDMKKERCDVVILEVSSHALLQGRLIGIPFTSAVFTNLSREHLDFHRNMENYSKAKQILFKNVERNNQKNTDTSFIINIDDSYKEDFLRFNANKKITFSLYNHNFKSDVHVFCTKKKLSFYKTCFTLNIEDKNKSIKNVVDLELNVLGEFSIMNSMAAVSAAYSLIGFDKESIKTGLEKVLCVPGRMEVVDTVENFAKEMEITCMIDFGLTPLAVKKLYSTLKDISKNKVISVFGACGNRDKDKRAIIGNTAMKTTDMVIVCDDETYGESFDNIRGDILKGMGIKENIIDKKRNEGGKFIKYTNNIYEIKDRCEAINFAVSKAEKGDVVVVSGIGDFDSRQIYNKTIPWNEREILREAIRNKYKAV